MAWPNDLQLTLPMTRMSGRFAGWMSITFTRYGTDRQTDRRRPSMLNAPTLYVRGHNKLQWEQNCNGKKTVYI